MPFPSSPREVFLVALRLGLTSFGGPIAHVGYFRETYVARHRWLDDRAFGELLAVAQALPGPASSKLGIAIGLWRAGWAGGLAAWLGFTLPTAILLTILALVAGRLPPESARVLHGLELAAVAVVALAAWALVRPLLASPWRLGIVGGVAIVVLGTGAAGAFGFPVPAPAVVQLVVVGGSVLAGLVLGGGWRGGGSQSGGGAAAIDAGSAASAKSASLGPAVVSRRAAASALVAFVGLLVALPLVRLATGDPGLAIADAFYRSGALVFGGGHVVLPLLEAEVVPTGWVEPDVFLGGYGAAQAMPGPLFAFAAYLGVHVAPGPGGVVGAGLATVAIFLPGALLTVAALPAWRATRDRPLVRAGLDGLSAGVAGLLAAALVHPIGTGALSTPLDAVIALVLLALLATRRVPVWLVVGLAAATGLAAG